MKISKKKVGILYTLPGLITLVVLIFYPVWYNVYTSFLRYDNIHPIAFCGLENYKWIFTSEDFYNSWKVSTLYSAGTTGLSVVMGLILAHSLSVISRGRAVFRLLCMISWTVPLVIAAFMWKWMLDTDLGIINYLLVSSGMINENIRFLTTPNLAIICGIITAGFSQIPFMTVLLLAGLESVPSDLYEAAALDGADHLHKFWYISLPLTRPQLLMGIIIIAMGTFRTPDVFYALTKGGPGKATYHAGLFLMDTIYNFARFGRAATIGVVLSITIAAFVSPLLYFYMKKT